MLDVITIGETMILFAPASAGALRYVHSFSKHIAGAESNLAIGLSKLGHKSGYITKIGNDEFGAIIRREVQGEGVDVSNFFIDDNRPTGVMFKQIANGDLTEVFYYREFSAASTMRFEDLDLDYLRNSKIIHLTGITAALSDSCAELVAKIASFANEENIALSFDPNIRLKLLTKTRAKELLLPLLKQCDIALLGLDEANILLGTSDSNEIIMLLREYGVKKIALKMGGDGSIVADANTILQIPPYPTTSVDSVGAGDAFNAGFLSGILQKETLQKTGEMGNAMGSLAVAVKGDIEGIADRKRLDDLLNNTTIISR